jgi:uncharacterized repeat protein (TIGR01451 family)
MLFGQAFLDLNGNGVLDPADRPLENVSVLLVSPGTQDTIDEVSTDTLGLFVVRDVPLGTYVLALDSAVVLADSLTTVGATGTVTVAFGDTAQVNIGATYPALTLEQVRAAVAGRRVFTSGIALNPRQNSSDGEVYFKALLAGDTVYLRATNVERSAPNLAIGDSVRLLGTTTVDDGQPTLDAVTPTFLVFGAQIVLPVEASVAQVASGNGGALDAALVRIRNVEITDTSTVSGDFHFWAYTGADSIEVVFRSFLGMSTAAVRPDTIVRITEATGLLSPLEDGVGNVRWRLLPRAASELTYQTKVADIAVGAAFDTAQASAGDTVEIRVTVRNAGPQTATNVQVSDNLPPALTFLSATATRGGYNSATRLWNVGNLPVSAVADTLKILATVTGGPGTAIYQASLGVLLREVESNPSNNVANAGLTIP